VLLEAGLVTDEGLTVAAVAGPGHVVISVAGDCDTTTEQQFRDALAREVSLEGRRRVVVDLSGVGFMGSAGVRVLVGINALVLKRGGSLVLASPQEIVARVLTLAGLDEVIPVTGSVAAALMAG
jgi:anti-anti-sigma factor